MAKSKQLSSKTRQKEQPAPRSARSVKQRALLKQSIIEITIGSFMIFAYPKWQGFLIGGLIVTLGLVLGVLYLRARREN